jgi:hypothetical protein
MRIALFLAFGLLAPFATMPAQSLDLGGVGLRLGEDATAAVERLRTSYDVSYQAAPQGWFVTRKNARPTDSFLWVAEVTVKNGLVSAIVKYYDLRDGSDLSTADRRDVPPTFAEK